MRPVVLCALAACVSLAIPGCESEPQETVPVAPVELGPQVSLRFPGGEPRYGSLVWVEVSVGNGNVNPILLRAVDLPGQLPDPVGWLASRPGRLKRERARDHYVWRYTDPNWTPPVFAVGLLYPGERLEFKRPFRFRAPSQEVVVRYQEVLAGGGSDNLFLRHARGTPPARRHYEMHFARGAVSISSAFRRQQPLSEERLALVPDPGMWPIHTRRFVESFPRSSSGGGVAKQVLEDLGHAGAELSRWDGGNTWLVRDPADGALLLYPDAGGEPERFPRLEFTVFDLADLAATPGSALWLETPETAEGPVLLESSELIDVARKARDRGWRMEVEVLDPAAPDRVPYLVLR